MHNGSVSAPPVPRMHGAQPASRAASEYLNDDVAWRTTPKTELRRAEAREQRKLTLVKKFRPEADAEEEQATMVMNAALIFWNSNGRGKVRCTEKHPSKNAKAEADKKF